MTQNQNNIRSVEKAVRDISSIAQDMAIAVIQKQEKPDIDDVENVARTQITSLLTHLKEQIEKEEMAVPADEYVSAALAPEVKSAPFDRGFDYGRSFTKKEDIALIDSLINPTQ